MADITTAVNENRKAGVQRKKRHHLKIDMTPMVDLGFLLISFFVVTTELSKPRAMDLFMPHDGIETPTKISTTITILTGSDNKLFYYYGEEKDAGLTVPIIQTTWDEETGIGKVISDKQKALDKTKDGREVMVAIIKPGTASTYKNMVDILDEMAIHRVTRYAIVRAGINDLAFLSKNK